MENLIKQVTDNNVNENKKIIEQKILLIEEEINKNNKTIERMLDGFENGLYTIEQFKERRGKIKDIIDKLQQDYNILNNQLNNISTDHLETKIDKIKSFKTKFNSKDITDIEKNKLYKSIIESIVWERKKDDITIKINYL